MKRIATIALFATAAAALAASSARADTRVRIGVNLGGPSYGPAPVVVAPPPAVVYAPAPVAECPPPAQVVVAPPCGYWREVQVRTWVPERWIVRTNHWGRSERYCEPGHYAFRTDRVWVDGRDEGPRGYAYGYGHDNRNYGRNYGRDYRYEDRGRWNR